MASESLDTDSKPAITPKAPTYDGTGLALRYVQLWLITANRDLASDLVKIVLLSDTDDCDFVICGDDNLTRCSTPSASPNDSDFFCFVQKDRLLKVAPELKRYFEPDSKAANGWVLRLEDVNAHTAAAFVQWVYTGSYSGTADEAEAVGSLQVVQPLLKLEVDLFLLGQCYNIPDLLNLSHEKIKAFLFQLHEKESCQPPKEEILRDLTDVILHFIDNVITTELATCNDGLEVEIAGFKLMKTWAQYIAWGLDSFRQQPRLSELVDHEYFGFLVLKYACPARGIPQYLLSEGKIQERKLLTHSCSCGYSGRAVVQCQLCRRVDLKLTCINSNNQFLGGGRVFIDHALGCRVFHKCPYCNVDSEQFNTLCQGCLKPFRLLQ